MALFTGESGGIPLIDSSTSLAMRRRATECLGLILIAFGGVIAALLWSYSPDDPSFWNATSRPAGNMLGPVGSHIADPLMKVMGLASWGFALVPIAWGLRCLIHRGLERIWARLLLIPLGLITAMVFASTNVPFEGWQLNVGLGGMLGERGARALLDLIPLADGQALLALSLGLGLLTAMLAGASIGLDAYESAYIAGWLYRSFLSVAIQLASHVMRLLHALLRAVLMAGVALLSLVGAKLEARRAAKAERRAEPQLDQDEAPRAAPVMRQSSDFSATEEDDDADASETPRTALVDRLPKFSIASMPGAGIARALTSKPEGLDATRFTGERAEPSVFGNPGVEDDPDALIAERDSDWPDESADDDRVLSRALGALSQTEDDAYDDSDDYEFDGAVSAERQNAASPVSHPPQFSKAKSRRAKQEREPMLALDGLEDGETYRTPPLDILARPAPGQNVQISDMALQENARMLETVLEDYGVRGEIIAVKPGPVVTLYELEPAPGLKASRVIGLADDIARSMSALAARVSTVPGRSVIGIELPNSHREKVCLRETLEHTSYGDASYPLALSLGKDIEGGPVVANLAKMPHLLIAGTTGSGKSVAINTMILSLLYRLSPEQCRMIMIDPKMLELSVYDNIPHLLAPVVTDPKKALVALKWVVAEMEERYRKMSKMGVRNIDGYNARVRDAVAKGEDFSRTVQTGFDEVTGEPIYETETFEPTEMPFIVVVVDEMADLMMVAGKEIEACIQRLAQMARASGIHLIMATQRPSVDVITGTIKANFPTRISFQVTSKIDSRTILGEQGAEQLLGMGDMLYMAGGGRIKRVHGPFVSDEEVEEVVQHLKTLGPPSYVNSVTEGVDEEAEQLVDEKLGLAQAGDSEDALYDRAVAIVARDRKCSTSYIQRKLAIGYNKAARLVEQMEDQGVVTAANAVGKRDILIEER